MLFNLKSAVTRGIHIGQMTREDLKCIIGLQFDAEKAPVTFDANELLHVNMQASIATTPTTFIVAPAAAEGKAAASASDITFNTSKRPVSSTASSASLVHRACGNSSVSQRCKTFSRLTFCIA